MRDVADEKQHIALPDADYLQLFAASLALAKDSLAVVSPGSSLTYPQLDQQSSALAAALIEQVGYGPEPVTIMCGHDSRAVVAFLAAIKSGRPAVFLDTTTPAARIQQVATQTAPIATLLDESFTEKAVEVGDVLGTVLSVESRAKQSAQPFRRVFDPDRPLCIVFTSGSTGIPKGVVLGNRSMCEEIVRMTVIGSGLNHRIGIPLPLSFFGGIGSMIHSLILGAQMFLYDPRRQGIDGMVDWVVDNRIMSLSLTPYGLRSLAGAAIARGVTFDSLVRIGSGGEPLLVSDVVATRQCTTDACVIMNASGSTEGWGISSLVIDRNYPLPDSGPVSTGAPFAGRTIYLENESGDRITEPGKAGMIVVVAERMADGYWRNPELTAERFSIDGDGLRVYRTGDMGRWNEKGELQYAGRTDHMMKIRGYLVEPAEVESHVIAHGEVKEAVVVGRTATDGATRMLAYVVPEPTKWVSSAAIRRRLFSELPTYMVPTVFVEIDKLPRNPNGKLDRLALPDPPHATSTTPEVWNSIELTVSSICATAIGVEGVGRNEDLLEIGADSLAIVEIISGLEEECDIVVTSAELLEAPTVAALAARKRHSTRLVRGVLVPLRQGFGPPLFCVAGAAGLGMAFHSMVRRLPEGRPVYGLQAYGLEGSGLADLSVEATARRYVTAIRQVQPHGPYHVVGHSLGGLIAFEIARVLTAKHEAVALLGLIDTFSSEGALAPERLERLAPRGEALLGDSGEQRARSLAAREYLFQRWPYLVRRYWVTRRDNRFVLYWALGTRMAERYRFTGKPVDLPMAIYQASGNPAGSTDWQQYVVKPPTVHTVPGDHVSMLREPFVVDLANAIATDLHEEPAKSA